MHKTSPEKINKHPAAKRGLPNLVPYKDRETTRHLEHRESWCQTLGAKLQKWCHVSKMEFGTRNAMTPEFSGSGLAPEF
ncbi:hypothetical protein Tco_1510938, partial [Tanacetum coccineum]